jgi:hypothetical protein
MPPDTTSSRYRSPSSFRARNVLPVRAGVARTFGGLGSFLAVIFLGSRGYLLQESFTDPLQAQAVGLIAGAFIIALATILIYFIFSPQKGLQSGQARHLQEHTPVHSQAAPASPPLLPAERGGQKPGRHDRKRLIQITQVEIRLAESPQNSALPICPGDAVRAQRP